jgi:SAM-dependent methyltransferase/GNAT superfamily N-acetyltransferase
MRLRRAVAGDAAALSAYCPQAGTGSGPEEIVVADVDGVAVGHVRVGRSELAPDVGRLGHLCVDPGHRGRGYGWRLLICGHRLLSRAGYRRATAVVPTGDAAALRLLQRNGWHQVGGGPLGQGGGGDSETDTAAARLETSSLDSDEHVVANRSSWDGWADSYAGAGQQSYQPERRAAPTWGVFGVPESELGLLADVGGCDVVELGCGTGYVSAWCLAAGARSAVGLDNSPAQLATAQALQRQFGIQFPLLWADAERVPLAANRFDLAISEYGAAIWCDPYRWIPEAARLLRPGGRLVFLGNSVVVTLCVPDFEHDGSATPTMLRPQRGMHRSAYPDTIATEFHLSHGDLIRLLRAAGFEILDLIEVYAPPGASSNHDFVDAGWASQWPAEEVWIARLRG